MKELDKKIHNYNKYKKRVKNLICNIWGYENVSDDFVCRLEKNTTPCSCPMCGNPRRHFGEKTIQERKNIIKFKEEIDEYNK